MADASPEIKFHTGYLVLDCTCVKDFMSCRRYAKYRYEMQLVPLQTSPALSFGHAIHEALFTWYLTNDQAKALLRFNEICDELGIPLDGDKRSKTNGAAILLHYFEQYRKETSQETRIAGEVGFCLPIPGTDALIAGRIDRVYERSGGLRIRDHKTAAQIGTSYQYNVNPDLSAQVYTWACETVLQREVELFEFDVLLVAKEKREAIRFPVMRSKWKIESALEDLKIAVRDIQQKIQLNEWERNTAHCSSYGGCRYHAICTTENPLPVITSMFKIESWRPYVAE